VLFRSNENENITEDKADDTVENITEDNPEDTVDQDTDDDDDEDDNSNNDDDNTMYNISRGNEGLVFVNQMIDYINRGEGLSETCLYEYCSKVYKTVMSDKEKEKHLKGKLRSERHLFSDDHPQSETHWQVVRPEGLVPSLSKLPKSITTHKTKYQKSILLLFKPFRVFTDLFNGISWNDSYETTDFTRYMQYIENIQEMHIGLEDKKNNPDDDNNDDDDDETVEDLGDEGDVDPTELTETDIDASTTQALDVIKSTRWLDESISTYQQPVIENICPLQPINGWKKAIKEQNIDRRDNSDLNEVEEQLINRSDPTTIQEELDVTYSVEACDNIDYDEIAGRIIDTYSLKKKQRFVF